MLMMRNLNKNLFHLTCALLWGLFISAQSHADLPSSGMMKSTVLAEYGSPIEETLPIGQPPISRWIYDQFTVVFEYDHVVHAFARLKQVEQRTIDQIPERPDFVRLIDQSNNQAVYNRSYIQRNNEPQLSAQDQIDQANQAIDTIQ